MGLFLFLSVAAASLFTFIAVTVWSGERRKEREAYYHSEVLKKIAESPGSGPAAQEYLRERQRISDRNTRGGVRLAGLVVFAHGSGSSRFSTRNQRVAQAMVCAGFGTLLFDLLTIPESQDPANVFDIALLADRLSGAVSWAGRQPETFELPIGLFGASTGAAAALVAQCRAERCEPAGTTEA